MVIIFFGNDEVAIEQAILGEKAKLGDETAISLNFSVLDGRSTTLDELHRLVFSIPFLAQQRIVLLTSALSLPKNETDRTAFISLLDSCPPSTLWINTIADENKYDSKTNTFEWQTLKPNHWLMKWAAAQPKEKAILRSFPLPKGKALAERICKEADNRISFAAAEQLIELIGEDTHSLKQEIEKLLAYVNYQRKIEESDVLELTVRQREENIFDFVDALGNCDHNQAVNKLSLLLEQQEPLEVFAMVVRQFRLLIQVRALLDEGAVMQEIADQVSELQRRIYMAKKLKLQAEHFSLSTLKAIYRRLCEIDEQVKTSQNTVETALFTLIAAITYKGST